MKQVFYVAWPSFDESKLVEDEIEIVVQINGKLKAKVMIEKDLPKDQLEKVALEAKWKEISLKLLRFQINCKYCC